MRALPARLVGAASGVFVANVAGALLTLAAGMMLARTMEVSAFGVYMYVLTMVNLAVVPALLGLDVLIVRLAAIYESGERWASLRALLRQSDILALWTTIALGAAAFGAFVLPGVVDTVPTMLGVLVLILTALTRLRQSTLRGLRRVLLAALPEGVLRPALIVAGVAPVMLVTGQLDAAQALLLTLGAAAMALIFAHVAVRRSIPAGEHGTREAWLKTALPMAVVGTAQAAGAHVDLLMLGAIAGSEAAGIYAAVIRIAALISFGLLAANALAGPMFARTHAENQPVELQRAATAAARLGLAVTLPVGTVVLLWPEFLLGLFGPGFEGGATALRILAVAQIVNAGSGPVALIVNMTGHHKAGAVIIGTCAVLNLILNAVLVPQWGITGAAVAGAVSLVAWNCCLIYYLRQRLGLHPTILGI